MRIEPVKLKDALDVIKARAEQTRSVQAQIKDTYEFADWPLAQMVTDRTAFDAKETLASDKDSDESAARDPHNALLDRLHEATKAAVGAGKIHFADDPATAGRFKNLSASAGDRAGRTKEASDLLIAWDNADPNWKPTDALTLAAVQTLHDQTAAAGLALDDAENNAAAAHNHMNTLANGLWDLSVDWYGTVTSLYGENTEIGALVRSHITASGGSSPTPTPPAPPIPPPA